MSILGIDQLTYGVDDLATCKRFFLDWGLSLVEEAMGKKSISTGILTENTSDADEEED